MLYSVHARLRPGTEAALLRRLTDGSVAAQRPDGREIVAAMERAVVTASGEVAWTETCYCSPPLRHERETVLDDHFAFTEIAPAGDGPPPAGTPLMAHLRRAAGG